MKKTQALGSFTEQAAITLHDSVIDWEVLQIKTELNVAAGGEGPNSVLMEVRLKIGQGNMVLAGEEKLKIVRAGMQSLSLTAHKYPETLGVSLSLDGVGLLSPEGTIARAGQELQQEDTDEALDSGGLLSWTITWKPMKSYENKEIMASSSVEIFYSCKHHMCKFASLRLLLTTS